MIFCVRRLPSLTREEFQRYWLVEHGPLVKRHAAALRIRRYVQSHSLFDPRLAAPVVARGAGVEAYDGIAELWWSSIEDIVAVGDTREGRAAGRALLADERHFIDLPNSPLFFVQEHEVIGDNARQ